MTADDPDTHDLRADGLRLVTAARERLSIADQHRRLFEKVARGDHQAFGELYDLMSAQAYGVIRRVVRDPAQSEEVLQEVMVEVWRTAPRYDATKGSVATWIVTLAHRRAVDRVRSEQSARERLDRDVRARPSTADDHAEEVVDQIDARFESERVSRALGELSPIQRESIELAFYGGHTHAEVAALLDIPLGTVKTRIRDGLVRLRDGLGVSS
jgi:RNA polymerase sigma-70 factor (ECF subfamily)